LQDSVRGREWTRRGEIKEVKEGTGRAENEIVGGEKMSMVREK
jgi:hypothetical protein